MHNGAERPRCHVRAVGAGLFVDKPYNGLRPTTDTCVGAGLPANTAAAATVNGQ